MSNLSDKSILMISFDAGLLKVGSSGDVLFRHREYAKNLKRLDIIVFGWADNSSNALADNCLAYGVGNKLSSLWRAWILAKKLMRKNNYDLVDTQDPHLTGLLGWLLKKKYKIKFELHFHGDFWQNSLWLRESKKNIFYNILQKIIVPRADAIRVTSHIIKDKLIKSGLNEKKIRVINTPVNQLQFGQALDQDEILAIKSKYPNKKIILFVGRLVAAKNLFFLLSAIEKLSVQRKDFVLVIIGAGEQEAELAKAIKEKDLAGIVFLLGAKNQAEILPYYRAADLNILLSTNESFGKVIIEAGIAGTPSLASKTSGALSIIEDGKTGWLVEINDLPSTVEKMNKILSSDNLKIVGQQAKHDFMRDYSQKNTYEKIQEFWWQIINDKL